MTSSLLTVSAEPNDWPLLGPTPPERAALLLIDLQVDFVRPGGWIEQMGFDLGDIKRAVPVIADVLRAVRHVPGMYVVHTRQGNAGDLSDLSPIRLEQGRRVGHPIGSLGPFGRGLIRGEPGWQIIEELAPIPGERIVDKPGYCAFVGTDLREWLEAQSVRNLILTGVTANVCVLSTLLAAVDLGYDCVLVSDAVGAADPTTNRTVRDLVTYQGGLFGSVTTSADLTAGLRALTPRRARRASTH